ncbi:MAG: T9SS type A sorting domain-containing protein [Fluviicola sp.]
MKNFITGMLLLMSLHGHGQTDTLVFKNPREMMEYAYSNTNFSNFPNPYFRNATMELEDSVFNQLTYKDQPINCTGSGIIGLFSLMNWWDMSKNFHRDSVLFPVYDHFYSLDEYGELHIPFYVVDLNVQALIPATADEFRTSSGADPYRTILTNDLVEQEVLYAAAFLDSFAYNHVILELNEKTFFTNTGRTVDYVEIRSGDQTKLLYYNSSVDLSDWLNGRQKLTYFIHFSDNKLIEVKQQVEMNERSTAKSLIHQHFEWSETIYPPNYTSSTIDNPDLKFATYYACADNKLRKPFIMVAGWGPHTDKAIINNTQNWPASLGQLANQFNQEGLIENLHDKGFDVILCQFFPPNAYVQRNAELLEELIKLVNNRKTQNDSYQENIIMGFSAGALATRLALQKMEYKHLNENGPHPHTKLYISNDGEHGGANIPLGMQHAVEYLWIYDYNQMFFSQVPFLGPALNNLYNTYALHYILAAPLSQQILYYFHSETGSGDSPGQGRSYLRNSYLAEHTYYNHAKNNYRLDYPSFQRMISISNGSSTPEYYFSNFSCNHYPYPNSMGEIFFKQNSAPMPFLDRRYEASFLKHGTHRVFYCEHKPWFKSWKSIYEATTQNPIVWDNAPGGIIFIEKNPIIQINDQYAAQLPLDPDIEEDLLYAFTPTVLTHDVKDLNAYLNNGYPNYKFKERNLMYDNEYDAASLDPLNASNYYGYPHLGYPGNHYDYTVFDALFCWNENTEHLTGNRKDPNAYAGMSSPMKAIQKNFVVEESEPDFIFLQNLRIGFFTRLNYQYKVDYEAGNTILLGNHVTQKTDFLDLVVESNAIVDAQAEQEIHFTPGVHIKSGSDLHAYIGEITCEKGLFNSSSDESFENSDSDSRLRYFGTDNTEQVSIFPNPSKQSITIQWAEEKKNERIEVQIFNLSGLELFKKSITCKETIAHDLKPGFYVVKLIKNGQCVTKNILVEQ